MDRINYILLCILILLLIISLYYTIVPLGLFNINQSRHSRCGGEKRENLCDKVCGSDAVITTTRKCIPGSINAPTSCPSGPNPLVSSCPNAITCASVDLSKYSTPSLGPFRIYDLSNYYGSTPRYLTPPSTFDGGVNHKPKGETLQGLTLERVPGLVAGTFVSDTYYIKTSRTGDIYYLYWTSTDTRVLEGTLDTIINSPKGDDAAKWIIIKKVNTAISTTTSVYTIQNFSNQSLYLMTVTTGTDIDKAFVLSKPSPETRNMYWAFETA